jgi:hypothetical protein
MAKNGKDDDMLEMDEGMEMPSDELYTELDEERRAEIEELIGLKVLGVEIWEDSLGDDEDKPPKANERVFFDCDLFFEENQAVELYVAAAYPDPDGDPVTGLNAIYDALGELADAEITLLDYGDVDEEGGLALAFGHGDHVHLVLAASAWMVSEWEADGESESDEESESDDA